MAETVNILPQMSPWNMLAEKQMQPADYEQLSQQMQEYGMQQQEAQRQLALANLGTQKLLTEAETPVDLSSLMALTDSWAGPNSKLQQGYRPPETALQRREMLSRLQAELGKTQEGMSQNQINLLKARLETQARKDDREAQREATAAQRDVANAIRDQNRADKKTQQYLKHVEDAQEAWNKDKANQDATTRYYEVSGVNKALEEARTNPALKGILPAKIARLQEKGVLTDQDIARYSGSQAFAAKWKQFVQGAEEGTITDENLALFKRVAEGFAADAEDIMNERASLHAKQFSKRTGVPLEESLSTITGGTFTPDILEGRKKTPPAPSYKPGDIYTDPDTGIKYEFKGGQTNKKENWSEVK